MVLTYFLPISTMLNLILIFDSVYFYANSQRLAREILQFIKKRLGKIFNFLLPFNNIGIFTIKIGLNIYFVYFDYDLSGLDIVSSLTIY